MVVFLQNAWSPVYAGRVWPRPSWIRALIRSRSGQRLRNLIDDFEVCENTTPAVGPDANSVMAPDLDHIRAVIARRRPKAIVCCGKQACAAVAKVWDGPLLAVPHPANRVLTNALYLEGRRLLATGLSGRVALRQLRQGIAQENL